MVSWAAAMPHAIVAAANKVPRMFMQHNVVPIPGNVKSSLDRRTASSALWGDSRMARVGSDELFEPLVGAEFFDKLFDLLRLGFAGQ